MRREQTATASGPQPRSPIQRRSQLLLARQASEAWASLRDKPSRSAATAGLMASAALLYVVIATLAQSAQSQVSSRFDARRATTVVLIPSAPSEQSASGVRRPLLDEFPADAGERLALLGGVRSATTVVKVGGYHDVAAHPSVVTFPARSDPPDLYAADANIVDTLDLRLDGPGLDRQPIDRRAQAAIVGSRAAERLGAGGSGSMVWIDGQAVAVVGIIEASPTLPELVDAVVVGMGTGLRPGWYAEDGSQVVVRTAPGGAAAVASKAPRQIRPDAPAAFVASAPLDPRKFREQIEGDTRRAVTSLSIATLAMGAVSSAVASMAAIASRRGAIGLLTALGATRAHVFRLVLTESIVVAALAGAVGALLGLPVSAAICLARDWQLVVPTGVYANAVALTVGAGALAGLIPATVAARLDPVAALRSG